MKTKSTFPTEIRILGVSDEVPTCDCCGKTNLKKTIVIEIDGDVQYWGTECAKQVYRFVNGTRSAILAEAVAGRIQSKRMVDRSLG